MGELTTDPQVKKHTAWDPNSGFGNHKYRKIDPSTVNPEDYAHTMKGDEKFYGDIREYNTGANEKHPETNVDLYDAGLIGTVFETDSPGYEGIWKVVGLFTVHAPKVWIKCARVALVTRAGVDGWEEQESMKEIAAEDLGLVVDDTNHFKQVQTKLLHRGIIDREQRRRVATGVKTRDVMKEAALQK